MGRALVLLGLVLLLSIATTAAAQDHRVREPVYQDKTMSEWAAGLKHRDVDVRQTAVEALGYFTFGTKTTLPHLLEALNDPDDGVRETVMTILCRTPDKWPGMTGIFAVLLRDPSAKVRAGAAQILCATNDNDCFMILIEALGDTDDTVRQSAVISLARMAPTQAKDHGPLLLATWQARVLADDHWLPSQIASWLPKAADTVLPRALAATRHDDPRVRMNAIWLCSSLGASKNMLQALYRRALRDPSDMVRGVGLRNIGQFESTPPFALPILVNAIAEGTPDVRAAAIQGLSNYQTTNRAAIPTLLTLARNDDHEVRSAALNALSPFNNLETRVVEPLLPLFDDPDATIRRQMIGFSNQSKNPAVHRKLLAAMHDDDAQVRQLACSFVPQSKLIDKDLILDEVLSCMANGEFPNAPQLGQHLQRLDPQGHRAVPMLVERIRSDVKSSGPLITLLAGFEQQGWAALTALAEDPDAELASTVISHILFLGVRIRPIALKAIKRPEPQLRVAAFQALYICGDKDSAAADEILAATADSEDAIRYMAYSMLWSLEPSPKVLRVLHAGLRDPADAVRRASILAVTHHKAYTPEIVATLFALTKDDEDSVSLALHALVQSKVEPRKVRAMFLDHVKSSPSFGGTEQQTMFALLNHRLSHEPCVAAILHCLRQEREKDDAWNPNQFQTGDNRCQLMTLLGKIGPSAKSAVPLLMEQATDWRPIVRRTAIEALGQIDAKRAIPLLRARVSDEDATVASAAKAILEKVAPVR